MSPSTDQRENREFAAEIKFLVTLPQAEQIRAWSRLHLQPDPNASSAAGDGYQITSLYFDTEKFDVFHRKGSFGRSKYRIRRYGPNETAFLERKLKTRGLVSKRRSTVQISELERLAAGEADLRWTGFWYHRRLLARRLRPVCQITYSRTARVSMTPAGPIRLTMDDAVKAVSLDGLGFRNLHEGVTLAENQVIIEMKYRQETPVLFKQLINEFSLTPQAVSKYRLAAAALGLVKTVETPAAGASDATIQLCLTS